MKTKNANETKTVKPTQWTPELSAAAPEVVEAAKYAQARIGNCWGIRKRVNRDFPHDCRTDALCPPCRLSAAIAKAEEGR